PMHPGEVQEDYRGLHVNRCARLRGLAHGGQVLVSAATADIVKNDLPEESALIDLGLHQLKDLPGSERVFQLRDPELPFAFPPLGSAARDASDRVEQRAGKATLIGRDREMRLLAGLLDDAAGGKGAAVLIYGEPGIGKTRLTEEL